MAGGGAEWGDDGRSGTGEEERWVRSGFDFWLRKRILAVTSCAEALQGRGGGGAGLPSCERCDTLGLRGAQPGVRVLGTDSASGAAAMDRWHRSRREARLENR